MNINKKKEGSSLIFTVIIFMFVMIVSGAMLSMVTQNYIERVVEGKRIENLYGSESGLDTAYNVIVKNIDNANQVAYKEVEILKNTAKNMSYKDFKDLKNKIDQDKNEKALCALYALYADIDYLKLDESKNSEKIKEDNSLIEKVINYEFRNKFKTYIENNIESNVGGTTGQYWLDATINSTTKQQVEYNGAEIKFYNNSDFNESNDGIKWKGIDGEKEIITSGVPNRKLIVKYKFDDEGKISIDHHDHYELKDLEYYEKENTEIALESKYKVNNEQKIGENERKLRAIYTLTVPNYYEITFKNSIASNTEDIPGITIGKSLNIDNSNVDVHGDIMIEGNSSSTNSIADLSNKYTNGVVIDNENTNPSKKINLYNNLYCRGTVKVTDNVQVNLNRNLYAQNMYFNSTSSNNNGTIFNVNKDNDSKVVLDNDLEVTADNAKINIRNFYGINEKTEDADGNTKKSSSIIVNNQKTNSVLTINNDAYIRGIAHINTEHQYKTGESVAVKGNYNAYSVSISGNENFTYDNPLQVLQGTLDEKAEHFYQYWKDGNISEDNTVKAQNEIDYGGVVFNRIENVHSIGTVVYGKVDLEKNTVEVEKRIKKAEDFGVNTSINNKIEEEQTDYAKNVYDLNIGNKKTGIKYDSTDIKTIKSIVKTQDINDYNSEDLKFKNGKYDIKNENTNGEAIKIKGVLIVTGDLTIMGKVDIEGDIIVLGNLNINNADVTLKYNRELTKDVQNNNLSKFYDIFGTGYGGNDLNTGTSQNTESNAVEFVTKLWKVGK